MQDTRLFSRALLTLAIGFLLFSLGARIRELFHVRLQPTLVVPSSAFDFGVLNVGRRVDLEFTVSNVGNAPLYLRAIRTDCGCIVPTLGRQVVPPGGNLSVPVEISAQTVGHKRLRVLIESNDPLRPNAVVLFTGTVAQPDTNCQN